MIINFILLHLTLIENFNLQLEFCSQSFHSLNVSFKMSRNTGQSLNKLGEILYLFNGKGSKFI